MKQFIRSFIQSVQNQWVDVKLLGANAQVGSEWSAVFSAAIGQKPNGCLKVKTAGTQFYIDSLFFGYIYTRSSAIVWSDHSINHFFKVEKTNI